MFCSWPNLKLKRWHPSCNWSHDYLPLLSIVHQLPTNFPQTFQSVRPMTYDQDIFDPSGEDLKTTTYRRRMSHQPHQTSFSKVSGNQRFVLRGIQKTRNIEPENRWKKAPKKRERFEVTCIFISLVHSMTMDHSIFLEATRDRFTLPTASVNFHLLQAVVVVLHLSLVFMTGS